MEGQGWPSPQKVKRAAAHTDSKCYEFEDREHHHNDQNDGYHTPLQSPSKSSRQIRLRDTITIMAGGVSVRDVDVSAHNVSRQRGRAGYRSHSRQAQTVQSWETGTGTG